MLNSLLAKSASHGKVDQSLSNTPCLVIIAIHGTFARGAAWARPNSAFATGVQGLLGDLSPQWRTFEWSGRNTHEARQAAAFELTEECKKLATTFPNSKFVLLSHSHAGNIALMAMRFAEMQELVNGVICMATPFITAEARDPKQLRDSAESMFHTISFVVGPILALLSGFCLSLWIGLGVVFGLILSAALYYGLFIMAGNHMDAYNVWKIIERQVDVLRHYDYKDTNKPVLCLRYQLDEAFVGLRSFSMAAEAPVKVASLLELLVGTLVAVTVVAFVVAMIAVPFQILRGCTQSGYDPRDSVISSATGVMLDHIGETAVLLILVPLFASFVRSINRVVRALIWGEESFTGSVVQFGISKVPALNRNLFTERILELSMSERLSFKLLHSYVYGQSASIDEVANFARKSVSETSLQTDWLP